VVVLCHGVAQLKMSKRRVRSTFLMKKV